jgi:hypothetical protein
VSDEERDLEDGDPAHREHPHRRRHHPWSDELHVSKEALPTRRGFFIFLYNFFGISLNLHYLCTQKNNTT